MSEPTNEQAPVAEPRSSPLASVPPMSEDERVLRDIYAAFNAKDIDGVLEHIHPDVEWPNLIDGGMLHGRDEVRAYWAGIFELMDPQLVVESIDLDSEGSAVVHTYQVVRLDDGILKEARMTRHRLTLRDHLVIAMEIIDGY